MRKHKPKQILCDECKTMRERCKIAFVDPERVPKLVCPKCWRDKDYDQFLYEHRGVDKPEKV